MLIYKCILFKLFIMFNRNYDNPVVVQSDYSLLLDIHHPDSEKARIILAPFCELHKSPEHIHTYRITPISLWNAASAGLSTEEILENLTSVSRYEIPDNVRVYIIETTSRFGKLLLLPTNDPMRLRLEITDPYIQREIEANKKIMPLIILYNDEMLVDLINRGLIKQELIKIGFPVKDMAPLKEGAPLPIELRKETLQGRSLQVRDYQKEATDIFYANNQKGSGYGVIVLPCGAGKTVVGMAIMERYQTNTLILTTNVSAVHQWRDELFDKTKLTKNEVGEYTGDCKEIKPVTIATYQILTWRADKEKEFPHFGLFSAADWGLIIYDEVHLLPAPVFRITAELQAIRRLGLTATLIREDGKETDVFSLVGPKRYDVPWKQLEAKGWIAEAVCREIRIDLPDELKIEYAIADKRLKYRIASENPEKIRITKELIANHPDELILVIGQYLDQLQQLAKELDAPIITGKTPNGEREKIYGAFKSGEIKLIVVSKVANFAIDLPDASVAIQVSGTFGSRQEEAQRLGRILRPKKRGSTFYTIITRYTVEEEFGANRQKFLAEQGYKYEIHIWD